MVSIKFIGLAAIVLALATGGQAASTSTSSTHTSTVSTTTTHSTTKTSLTAASSTASATALGREQLILAPLEGKKKHRKNVSIRQINASVRRFCYEFEQRCHRLKHGKASHLKSNKCRRFYPQHGSKKYAKKHQPIAIAECAYENSSTKMIKEFTKSIAHDLRGKVIGPARVASSSSSVSSSSATIATSTATTMMTTTTSTGTTTTPLTTI